MCSFLARVQYFNDLLSCLDTLCFLLITPKNVSSKCTMFQLFLGGVVWTPNIVSGISVAFSAVTLPEINYSDDDSSWFGKLLFSFDYLFGLLIPAFPGHRGGTA